MPPPGKPVTFYECHPEDHAPAPSVRADFKILKPIYNIDAARLSEGPGPILLDPVCCFCRCETRQKQELGLNQLIVWLKENIGILKSKAYGTTGGHD